MTIADPHIAAIRRFSRFYTQRIGLLSDGILDSAYSLSEARVLYELAQGDHTTGAALASELDLDPGYVSRIIRRFERRGLVGKARSTDDRRRVLLTLTPIGADEFARLNSGSRTQTARLIDALDAAARDEVIAAMATIERLLDDGASNGSRVTYRPHRPGDMGWITQRHGELYHDSHGWDERFEAMVADITARFIEQYDPAGERCWIAEVDGRRAGSIALVRHADGVGQLRLLLVEPWARGRGIGGRLVSECVGHARHVGYERMILFTVRGLDGARKLYEAEGFELTSEEPGHEWGHDHVAQTWGLTL